MATAKASRAMVGKTVKYLGAQPGKTYSNFNAPIGSDLVITGVRSSNNGLAGYNVTCPSYGNGFVYVHEVTPLVVSAEDLQKDINEKEAEIVELKAKLSFINKFGLDNYDDDEFKAYMVLETLGMEDIQKAKAIVKILSK
jgi:hypothetical protein